MEFKDWWKDFKSYHKGDKDGGLEELRHLKIVVASFSDDKRTAIIDELININKIVHACELIQLFGNTRQKRWIREKFSEWITTKSDKSIAHEYLMTILKTFEASDMELVRVYFNEQRGKWFHIPVELYSIDKSIFLDSFEILLNKWSDENLYKYDGLLYLTEDLEILEFLIDNLSVVQSKRIQEFCRVKSISSFVNTEIWKMGLMELANKENYGSQQTRKA